MKPSTTAERLQEAMNIRGLKQVDVLRLAEPYCRAYGVNLGPNMFQGKSFLGKIS